LDSNGGLIRHFGDGWTVPIDRGVIALRRHGFAGCIRLRQLIFASDSSLTLA
jgi:hypothetical protein